MSNKNYRQIPVAFYDIETREVEEEGTLYRCTRTHRDVKVITDSGTRISYADLSGWMSKRDYRMRLSGRSS